MADAKIPNPDRLAFPVEYSPQAAYLRGLSKREYLAGQALVGLLAFSRGGEGETYQYKAEDAARVAVRMADALLAELGEPIP